MKSVALACALLTVICPAMSSDHTNHFYPGNLAPLHPAKLVALPVGAVKPAGWLKNQLTLQAKGLTGYLDEFWPSVRDSAWKGKAGDAWERGPYYLDGLVPLAYQLDDNRLKKIARTYLEWILASQQTNGWFGPAKNKDRWPLAVAMKVLTQYQEATGDERVIPLLKNYFAYLKATPPDWPDKEWRGVRAMENVLTAHWLYHRTGDPDVLAVAESIFRNSFDWTGYFHDFPYPTERMKQPLKYGHPTHVVNIAMAIKHPGVWWQQAGDERFREAVDRGIASLDEHHGQVGGRFAGDEHLSGRRPTQGTELCGVVEYMFSLEHLVRIFGDAALGDRLEMLAYNGNPGTCLPDYWAHQYDQQANQVLVSRAKRRWSTNGDDSNLYGLEPNFGCCTANMHQGWPKFVAHLWMATPDNGLAAVAYGPCVVNAKVAEGVDATLIEETDYPFAGAVKFTVKLPRPAKFPLQFRIPVWAEGATLRVNGQPSAAAPAGAFAIVSAEWKSGDVIELDLPMNLRLERRYQDAVAIYRGPLVFSLRIGESYRKLKSHHPTLPVVDWEITPTTPWNYGLILNPKQLDRSIQVATSRPGSKPFSQETAPVVLTVRGRALPDWKLVNHSAGETPASPATSEEPVTELELVPYGCTRLRVTEFPVLAQ